MIDPVVKFEVVCCILWFVLRSWDSWWLTQAVDLSWHFNQLATSEPILETCLYAVDVTDMDAVGTAAALRPGETALGAYHQHLELAKMSITILQIEQKLSQVLSRKTQHAPSMKTYPDTQQTQQNHCMSHQALPPYCQCMWNAMSLVFGGETPQVKPCVGKSTHATKKWQPGGISSSLYPVEQKETTLWRKWQDCSTCMLIDLVSKRLHWGLQWYFHH